MKTGILRKKVIMYINSIMLEYMPTIDIKKEIKSFKHIPKNVVDDYAFTCLN